MFECFKKKDAPRPNPSPGSMPPSEEPALFQGSKRGEKRLWYPPAVQHFPKMPRQGAHEKNYPKGLVVHFNAGWHKPSATIDGGIKNGYLYDAMGPDGVIRQANPLSDWGWHTGGGAWRGPDGKTYFGMHRYCRGVEITSAGKLDSNKKSWFGFRVPDEKCRFVEKRGSIREGGFYEAYTKEQEKSLINYCLWLKWNNPEIFDFDWVIGHEECSTQKTDPGGALSMTMQEFRAMLKIEYAKLGG